LTSEQEHATLILRMDMMIAYAKVGFMYTLETSILFRQCSQPLVFIWRR